MNGAVCGEIRSVCGETRSVGVLRSGSLPAIVLTHPTLAGMGDLGTGSAIWGICASVMVLCQRICSGMEAIIMPNGEMATGVSSGMGRRHSMSWMMPLPPDLAVEHE